MFKLIYKIKKNNHKIRKTLPISAKIITKRLDTLDIPNTSKVKILEIVNMDESPLFINKLFLPKTKILILHNIILQELSGPKLSSMTFHNCEFWPSLGTYKNLISARFINTKLIFYPLGTIKYLQLPLLVDFEQWPRTHTITYSTLPIIQKCNINITNIRTNKTKYESFLFYRNSAKKERLLPNRIYEIKFHSNLLKNFKNVGG